MSDINAPLSTPMGGGNQQENVPVNVEQPLSTIGIGTAPSVDLSTEDCGQQSQMWEGHKIRLLKSPWARYPMDWQKMLDRKISFFLIQ